MCASGCLLLRRAAYPPLRPISVLRFWTSEGFAQAQFEFQGVEFSCPRGNFPEVLSQRILAGVILVGRLGVRAYTIGYYNITILQYVMIYYNIIYYTILYYTIVVYSFSRARYALGVVAKFGSEAPDICILL